MKNNTLLIKNLGNVPYKKPIEVSIGGVTDVKDLDLEIGKSIVLTLGAPDGEYDIAVNDGNSQQELGRTFLTGRAIGIGDVENVIFSDIGIWIWTLFIVILIIAILILWRKIALRKYVGKPPKIIMPVKRDETKQDISSIGAVLDRGIRQEAGIVALKIKNLSDLQRASEQRSNSLESLDSALLQAKAAGAKIYVDNDYRIMIFVPSITKEQDNSMNAIVVAKEVETILQSYNKTTQNKVNYGIGVHIGQVAVESQDNKFKFVSLDNTIAIAKRIAENSKGEALLSEPLHKRTLGKVKSEKLNDTSYWQLKQITDRSNYDEFIKRFLVRQKKGV